MKKPVSAEPPVGLIKQVNNIFARLYGYARHDIGAIWRAGWRPALGFTGCYVALYNFVIAPAHGVHVDANAANTFLAMVFVQALGRGVEKVMADRNPAAG